MAQKILPLKQILFILLEMTGLNALFRAIHRGRIKVLMYHSVSSHPTHPNAVKSDDFIRQLTYLKKNFNLISLSPNGDFLGCTDSRVNILLTFDDGFIDNFTEAVPILRQVGASGIFFVIGNCVDQGLTPSFASQKGWNDSTMDVPRLRQLIDLGFSVGSHTMSHLDLQAAPFAEGIQDCLRSIPHLETRLDTVVSCLALPWGRHLPGQIQILKASFRRIFTTNHGFNSFQDQVFCRNEVANYWQMTAAASGTLDFFRRKLRKG